MLCLNIFTIVYCSRHLYKFSKEIKTWKTSFSPLMSVSRLLFKRKSSSRVCYAYKGYYYFIISNFQLKSLKTPSCSLDTVNLTWRWTLKESLCSSIHSSNRSSLSFQDRFSVTLAQSKNRSKHGLREGPSKFSISCSLWTPTLLPSCYCFWCYTGSKEELAEQTGWI